MKYEQPYGISDPNASYINGNPSTGTMGSIPPAASIENPQREIVNFINVNSLTPTDADLLQLSKAVQAGLVNWGVDNGVVNQISITPVVPISAYALGQRFVIKVKYGNTSQVTINVSGIGNVPLIHVDQSPMNAYELLAGQLIEVAYDGAHFQAIGGVGNGAVIMTGPHDLYVSDSIGSDTLYDGTSAAISGVMGGPFKTIQKALATMTKYNLGGWTFTIHVADGTYTNTSAIIFPLPNGSGYVHVVGNVSNPSAVSIFNTTTGSCFNLLNGGHYGVDGFAFRATAGTPSDAGNGVWTGYGTNLSLGRNSWGPVPGAHMNIGAGSTCGIGGETIITGAPASAHIITNADAGCFTNPSNPQNLTITAPITVTDFVDVSDGAILWAVYGTITGAGSVTGAKYGARGNGVINTFGRGVSYLPGSTAGSVNTGGQYL